MSMASQGERKSKSAFLDAAGLDLGMKTDGNRADQNKHPQNDFCAQNDLLELTENRTPKSSSKTKQKDLNAGHRQRLRARLMTAGAEAVPDYEMLELILFRAIPRRDTKPIAKRLLKRFGSFSEVINAPPHLLKEVSGVGDAAIAELKLVREASIRLMKDQVVGRPVLSSWPSVLDYCKAHIGYQHKEQFNILFLDRENKLIADEMQSSGTVDHTPVYVREVVKRSLELSATAIILVHNHPSGNPKPSRADIEMTRQIEIAAKPLNIVIHDHIIVGRNGHMSFRQLGLI